MIFGQKTKIIRYSVNHPDDLTCPIQSKYNNIIKNSVIAIGNFDGLHHGHQHVINQAKKIAQAKSSYIGIISFYPHPGKYFGSRVALIDSIIKKYFVLSELNIDYLMMIKFNHHLASLSAEEFVQQIIHNQINASDVVTGQDFCFGKERTGNADLMSQYAKKYGFAYHPIPMLELDNKQQNNHLYYSSRIIRQHLANSELKQAHQLIGRNFSIISKVRRGEQIGHKLGFPTANLSFHKNSIAIPYGVYSGKIIAIVKNNSQYIKTQPYLCAVNWGERPTIDGKSHPALEAHIIDYDALLSEIQNINPQIKDLYGLRLQLEFIDNLRKEVKFDGVEQLKTQIANDISKIKQQYNNI